MHTHMHTHIHTHMHTRMLTSTTKRDVATTASIGSMCAPPAPTPAPPPSLFSQSLASVHTGVQAKLWNSNHRKEHVKLDLLATLEDLGLEYEPAIDTVHARQPARSHAWLVACAFVPPCVRVRCFIHMHVCLCVSTTA